MIYIYLIYLLERKPGKALGKIKMKIYLAGGMPVMLTRNRERALSNKFETWRRLFSFFFMNCINKSEILIITKESINENQQRRTSESIRKS